MNIQRFAVVIATAFLLVCTSSVKAQSIDHFEFDSFNTGVSKIAGLPFQVTIRAINSVGDVAADFNQSANLIDETGTVYPSQTSNFTNGVWTGMVYITRATTSNTITASISSYIGQSSIFSVVPDNRMSFLTIISGNNQTTNAGSLLPATLIGQVIDPYGNPIPGATVNFAVVNVPTGATGYNLSNNSASADADGLVSTSLRLGKKSGSYIVSATVTTGIKHSVQFYATAIPGAISSMIIRPSITIIPPGQPVQFEAIGYDLNYNEIINPAVDWLVQNGGGTIDATGLFRAGYTLGNYSNTIKAVSSSISATATVSIVDIIPGGDGGSDGSLDTGNVATAAPSPEPTPAQGILYNIQIEPDVISVLKNVRIPILAEGVDFFGNPVSGVSYEFSTTGDIGTITQTGPNSALLTGSGTGVGTVSVTATQGNLTRSARVIGSIGASNNRRLVIEDIASPQQVGEPFTISIAAKDSLNNFVTDYQGPLVIADTTGTIDPAVVQPSDQGIWYVQAIINAAHPEVSITVAGDGMVGVSNVFEVTGDPKKSQLGLGSGGFGLGDVLGASISSKINEMMKAQNLNKYAVVKYIGAGLAAGFGILGASIGGGLMASRGLEAIGRNPFAKGRLQANLYVGLVVFIVVASLAVFASTVIIR